MSHENNPVDISGFPDQNMKEVLMPSQINILEKLRQANFFGITPQTDKCFSNFTSFIAARNICPGGFNLGWMMYMREGLSEEEALKLHINFGFIVDVISPDIEFAEKTKEYRREFIAEWEKTAKEEMAELERALDPIYSPTIVLYMN